MGVLQRRVGIGEDLVRLRGEHLPSFDVDSKGHVQLARHGQRLGPCDGRLQGAHDHDLDEARLLLRRERGVLEREVWVGGGGGMAHAHRHAHDRIVGGQDDGAEGLDLRDASGEGQEHGGVDGALDAGMHDCSRVLRTDPWCHESFEFRLRGDLEEEGEVGACGEGHAKGGEIMHARRVPDAHLAVLWLMEHHFKHGVRLRVNCAGGNFRFEREPPGSNHLPGPLDVG